MLDDDDLRPRAVIAAVAGLDHQEPLAIRRDVVGTIEQTCRTAEVIVSLDDLPGSIGPPRGATFNCNAHESILRRDIKKLTSVRRPCGFSAALGGHRPHSAICCRKWPHVDLKPS